jgi:small GTP-binding protein
VNYLYECQCAVFLVDITNSDSFKLVKNLIGTINLNNFSYLKVILAQNKLDLESTRQVTNYEIKEYLEKNSAIEGIEISVKNGDNLKELAQKINNYVNNTKNELPMNIVSESVEKKVGIVNGQGSLSFILIGDSTVGKTCFLTRYFKNQFQEAFLSTIGIDKEIKLVKVGNDCYKMTLWDTAGQERFKCLPKKYYQNADGVLLLFDVTNEQTFNNVTNWMKDVKENSIKDGKDSKIALFLIGNKIDKPDRVISREQAETQANSLGMKYFEVSCKTNINIHETMARMIIDCYKRVSDNAVSNNIQLTNAGGQKKKGGCCDKKKK